MTGNHRLSGNRVPLRSVRIRSAVKVLRFPCTPQLRQGQALAAGRETS